MGKTVYRSSVEMAGEILGGYEAVAKHLGVTTDEVLSWADGKTEPAIAFFFRMVDLIEQKTVNAARTATVVRSKRDEGS